MNSLPHAYLIYLLDLLIWWLCPQKRKGYFHFLEWLKITFNLVEPKFVGNCWPFPYGIYLNTPKSVVFCSFYFQGEKKDFQPNADCALTKMILGYWNGKKETQPEVPLISLFLCPMFLNFSNWNSCTEKIE